MSLERLNDLMRKESNNESSYYRNMKRPWEVLIPAAIKAKFPEWKVDLKVIESELPELNIPKWYRDKWF